MTDNPGNEAGRVSESPSVPSPAPPSCAILVLGAGELGMAVLRHLARRAISTSGVALSVLLRPDSGRSAEPRKQAEIAELRSLGVGVVFTDLAHASVAELARLLGQFHTVVGCTGFAAGRGIQLKLAQAVIVGEVQRYLPWQFGVDYDVIGRGSAQDLFDEQLDVRDLLRSQHATEWIIISTGMFTSFLFEPAFGVVDRSQNTVCALGRWDNAVTVTTAEDIGMLTAEILFAEPRIVDRIVYTAGDTITYSQLADTIELVLRRKMHRVIWTETMLKEQLSEQPDSALRKYRLVFAQGRGVAWATDRTFNSERSIPVVGVERWMREHLQ